MFSNLLDSVRDYLEARLDDVRGFLGGWGEGEENDDEDNIFDEADQSELEEEEEEIADILDQVDSLTDDREDQTDEIEIVEPESIDDTYDVINQLRQEYIEEENTHFPDWINDDDKQTIIDELGVTDFDDLTDAEKDNYIGNDWRGFDEADVPASDIPEDKLDDFRDQIAETFNIPIDILNQLTEDELMVIATLGTSDDIEDNRGLDWNSPEETAEALDIEFRGTFDEWEGLVNSPLWEFILERPDLFQIWTNEDGSIEVYEVY